MQAMEGICSEPHLLSGLHSFPSTTVVGDKVSHYQGCRAGDHWRKNTVTSRREGVRESLPWAALCSASVGTCCVTILAQCLVLGRHFVAMHGKEERLEERMEEEKERMDVWMNPYRKSTSEKLIRRWHSACLRIRFHGQQLRSADGRWELRSQEGLVCTLGARETSLTGLPLGVSHVCRVF